MPKTKRAKRKDGRLQSSVYLGHDENGKRKYKTVYADTKKELDAKVNDIKIKIGKGIDISAERDTFDFWGQKWLKFKASDVSESWHNALKIYYKKLSNIHNVQISKLKAADLKDILIELSAENYSKRVIKAVHNVAVGVMNLAVENCVLDSNPFTTVKQPKNAKSPEQRRALTTDEQSWIINTPHRAQTAAMIMMFAGLRRGELIPLQWSDIDLKNGTITVSKSVEMIKGQPIVKSGGKTTSASRVVYIPEILIEYLRKQPKTSFLVCPSASGKAMSNTAWRRLWESYLNVLNKKYGNFGNHISIGNQKKLPFIIPNITAHWLRHTFITSMYLAGVDILTAKEQAGHSDVSTTLEIYSHLDSIYKRKNISKYNDYLKSVVNGSE